jgi:transcriptional regulator with PAS, ATPase and Fis domain
VPDDPKDEELRRSFAELGFFTASGKITAILRQARRAACVSDITVLLEGETGTGKGVLARAIHDLDQKRRSFPFITMHCGSLSEALAESELFGHQRGAFSGAVSDRRGLFRAADRGTLLLDDINDLPLQLQPKLLDVLQRGAVRSVGSDQETRIDVRLIAASNQPLASLLQQKRFRTDLYYRLNVVKLVLPPLRERMQDLPELLLALAHRHRGVYQPIAGINPELVRFLESKPFFGNARELENAVKRMLFQKKEGSSLDLADWLAQSELEVSAVPLDPVKDAADALWKAISEQGVSYTQALRETERKVLEIALSGHAPRRQVAQRLRTSERTLYYKMRAHGLGTHCE